MLFDKNYYICFYHNPCNDGEMASCIWKSKYPNTYFHHWDHSNIENNLNILYSYKNKNIVFLDCCPKPEYLDNSNKYIVIDHHKNAVEELQKINKKNVSIIYDINRSGCMLTWDYLYPNSNYPIAVYHTGMNDLFKFDNDETEYFCLGRKYCKINTEILLNIDTNSDTYKRIVEIGKNKSSEYRIEAMGYFMHLLTENEDGVRIIKVQCDNYKLVKYMVDYARSHLSHYNVLKIQNSFGKVSLRSIDGTHVDSIARKYGGNGHPLAAGYNL
jgi:nanoRNase/pAp phosphatase (c-di-AMP/oligoRNAs hydrolase)